MAAPLLFATTLTSTPINTGDLGHRSALPLTCWGWGFLVEAGGGLVSVITEDYPPAGAEAAGMFRGGAGSRMGECVKE